MRARSIDIYEADYLKIAQKQKPPFLSPAENLIRAVNQNDLSDGKDRSALDFGCGDGRNSEYLLSLGYEVVATDVSKGAIEATVARMGKDAATHLLKENEPLPLQDDTIDLVVSWEVLHWLGSKDLFEFSLNEFARICRANARMIVTMPTEDHFLIPDAVEQAPDKYLVQSPERKGCVIYAPNRQTLIQFFETFGYRPQAISRYDTYGDVLKNETHLPFSMYVFTLSFDQ